MFDKEPKSLQYEGVDKNIEAPYDEGGLTVLELLAEMRECGEKESANTLIQAERNERFVNGKQSQDINKYGQMADIHYSDNIPQVTHNLLRNMVLTWAARLTRDRQTVKAWPATDEPQDVAAAEVATAVWEHLEYQHDFDKLLLDTLRQAGPHGTAAVKVYYSKQKDMVCWSKLTVFDYFIDPTEELEDAQWVCFKEFIKPHKARFLLKNALKKKAPAYDQIEMETYEVADVEREGVPCWEMWHLPCERIPNGLYAKVVGGHVIDKRDYPYIFQRQEIAAEPMVDEMGEPVVDERGYEKHTPGGVIGGYAMLPIAVLKVDSWRSSPYGDTWVSDVVGIQKEINENESVKTKLRRDFGNVKMTVPKRIADNLNDESQLIPINDPDEKLMIDYVAPPQFNPILFSEGEHLEKRMYDISGMNELLTGAEGAKSGTSARQIRFLSELNSMQQSGTVKNIEHFIKRLAQLSLELVQEFYSIPRVVRINGVDKSMESVIFVGSDIQGADIRLEPRQGIDRFKSTQQDIKKEEALQGLRDPASAMEAGYKGTDTTVDQQHQIEAVKNQITEIMQGQQPQPIPLVDPSIATQVLEEQYYLLRQQQVDPNILVRVQDLIMMYKQMKMQTGVGVPGGGPGAHAKGQQSHEQEWQQEGQRMHEQ